MGGGEFVAALLLMVWPDPTLLVLVVVTGSWTIARALVDVTVALASRKEGPRWKWRCACDAVEVALAAVLIGRLGGTVHDASITLGALAIVGCGAELSEAVVELRPRSHVVPRSSRCRPA